MSLYPRVLLAALFTLGLCTLTLPAQAQRTSGAVGIGGQVGGPTGVTIKVYNAGGPSYDFLGAWDARDSFFLFNVHAQFNTPRDIENLQEGQVEWFVGPGAFIGVFDEVPGDDDLEEGEAVLGGSGRVGLNYAFGENFEAFAQLTPRLSLIPGTAFSLGGGIGFRFYP